MAETLKVLGQASPAVTTLTALYTVPASTQATLSTIVACNRNNSNVRVRISIAIAGAADTVAQYIVYDTLITNRDSLFLTIGATLGATDVVRVYTDSTGVSFSAFGVELT